jgi:Family of unknown function (DUF6998)
MNRASQIQLSKDQQWKKTPNDILEEIKKAEAAVSELQKIAVCSGITRKFTLDGRLVGDIGELIIARYFQIVKSEKPKGHAHDLFAKVGSKKLGVQVKLRREATTGKLEFKYQPEVLIVLGFKKDWSRWRFIFHGSGRVINSQAITVRAGDFRLMKGKRAKLLKFSLEELEERHRGGKFSSPTLKLKSCH